MNVLTINPNRVELVMQGRHLKWLNDGVSFLRHLDDLVAIKIEARCQICGKGVTASPSTDGISVSVSCPHRHGKVVVMEKDAPRNLEVQPLLLALGWNLHCTDCGEPINGDNDATQTRFAVSCPCTTRRYQMAVV